MRQAVYAELNAGFHRDSPAVTWVIITGRGSTIEGEVLPEQEGAEACGV